MTHLSLLQRLEPSLLTFIISVTLNFSCNVDYYFYVDGWLAVWVLMPSRS